MLEISIGYKEVHVIVATRRVPVTMHSDCPHDNVVRTCLQENMAEASLLAML